MVQIPIGDFAKKAEVCGLSLRRIFGLFWQFLGIFGRFLPDFAPFLAKTGNCG